MVPGEALGKEKLSELRNELKEADSLTLLLLGVSRLFDRMDKIEKTIRNSMYPIWISIVAGIVAYIIINKPFF